MIFCGVLVGACAGVLVILMSYTCVSAEGKQIRHGWSNLSYMNALCLRLVRKYDDPAHLYLYKG